MGEKVLCYDCYYYSVARYGRTCSFSGEFNPLKTECPNYRQRGKAEAEKLESIEATKLLLSIVNGLIDLQPEVEKLENGALKDKLTELCLVAKQVRKLVWG